VGGAPEKAEPARLVAAAISAVFTQNVQAEGSKAWRHFADQLRPRAPKLSQLMDEAEADVVAFMAFPKPTGRNCIQPIRLNG